MPSVRPIPAQYLSWSAAGALTLAAVSGQQMNLNASKFLFGTGGVDSGALLQIGTNTTTSAGGAIFGTDVPVYRDAAGSLALGAGALRLLNYTAGVNTGLLRFGNTALNYLFFDGSNVIFRLNGNDALTLDSSQNALFAGSVATAAPTGGSGVWKLGKYTAGVLAAAGYITVNIDGTDRRLLVG